MGENTWKIVDFESLDEAAKELIKVAAAVRENSYSPYSHFKVGAALRCADESISTGCNVENSSYGATICAERAAIAKAVSEGKTTFTSLSVVASHDGEPFVTPCGICRQSIAEFGNMPIYISKPEIVKVLVSTTQYLLPIPFGVKSF